MQISINGMSMTYDEHGAGPAVLLLHGFPFDRRIWKSHTQALALAGYRVVAPEFRGFGPGSALPGDYSLDVLSDDVIGLLNHLGIGRAAIVGLSLGAHVLNTLLKRYPQKVAAAVFIDPLNRQGGHAETECLLELVTKRANERRDELIDALAEELLPGANESVRQWVKAADDRLLALTLQTMRERTVVRLGAGHAELPKLRLGTGRFDEQYRQYVLPPVWKCTDWGRGSLDHSKEGMDLTQCLLDFFISVKQFRPRCQIYRQVA